MRPWKPGVLNSLLAVGFLLALPSFAFASTLVWGDQNGGVPARIEITDGGTYALPLNTSASIYIDSPFAFFAFSGKLYRINDSGGSPVRQEITTLHSHNDDGDPLFAWPSTGHYELDLPLFEPPVLSLNDKLKLWVARIFFADIANAQVQQIETIHFTVEEAVSGCSSNCFSNILFLPGFQASRLYQGNVVSENQVWEPDSVQSDAQRLYLNSNGQSINPTYTKADATIDSVGPFFSRTDIYKTFLAQLTKMVASDTIADFRVFPYDWRMSVDDIVEHGTIYNDGTHYPAAELEELAANSKSGKVTIIAHSNGGLLAKALMLKLQAEGKTNLVDKIIFVGTPQLGTPKAVASILHGDFQNIPGWAGFLISKANARALGENMPGAFGLLPSPTYFARVADPVINLSAAPSLRTGTGLPSSTVDSAAKLARFLTGAGGRAKPAYDDIETPDVLSSSLLGNATSLHARLDTWMPPPGVEVIQIAGWGLDTPKGVTYQEKPEAFCSTITCLFATTTQHVVEMTEDGDGTVVSASAIATTTWPTFYIRQRAYNNEQGKNTDHGNLLETQPVQELISFLLSSTTVNLLPSYVSNNLPPPTIDDKRLRLHVLSPVSLDAYDNSGNHTGMAPNSIPGSDLLYKEENIPNSYYEEFGEGKYLGLPAGIPFTIKLKGLAPGTFTFEITPVTGGVEGTTTSYANIPVSASTTAVLAINAPGQPGPLALDSNGDGKTDATFTSSKQTTDPQIYVKLIMTNVTGMDLGLTTKTQLLAKFTAVAALVPTAKITGKTIVKLLEDLELYIKQQLAKSNQNPKPKIQLERITPTQAEGLLDMISILKKLVTIK